REPGEEEQLCCQRRGGTALVGHHDGQHQRGKRQQVLHQVRVCALCTPDPSLAGREVLTIAGEGGQTSLHDEPDRVRNSECDAEGGGPGKHGEFGAHRGVLLPVMSALCATACCAPASSYQQ